MPALSTLSGPRLLPQSGERPRKLVVFLHGYGADGNDLIDIGRLWAPILPQAAFSSPNAVEPCAGAPMGRQWFSLTFRDQEEIWRGVQATRPILAQFLESELSEFGLIGKDLALVGFSQGTMMALDAATRFPAGIAGVVGYSGLLAGAKYLAEELRRRPPVLLVHGERDQVIPVQALRYSAEALAGAGLSVEAHVRPLLGHGIDQEGLRLGVQFLQRVFTD